MQIPQINSHVKFDYAPRPNYQSSTHNRDRAFRLFIVLLSIFGLCLGYWIASHIFSTSVSLSPAQVPQVYAAEVIEPSHVAETPKVQHTSTGYVSYYSMAGCLGCSKSMKMGNGQPFDENAMTLAVPCEKIRSKELKYGTFVVVTNTSNGKTIKAKITDCGGFSKYNRIADLSKGLANILEAKTDKSIITLEIL